MQELYINLDDSGKFTCKEKICVYGGIVFLSKKEKDKFITQYRSIIKSIKCKYCTNNKKCNHICPEIKNTNIFPGDKRRIINYIKKYYVIALVIKNEKVYSNIIKDKASRGRFIDYTIRRMIKNLIKKLIYEHRINPLDDLKIIINIDEQTTKNNGYYCLRDGIIEELKYGITNFNYGNILTPIIKGKLSVKVLYQNSENSYCIQAADILAGTIRRYVLNVLTGNLKYILPKIIDLKIYFP